VIDGLYSGFPFGFLSFPTTGQLRYDPIRCATCSDTKSRMFPFARSMHWSYHLLTHPVSRFITRNHHDLERIPACLRVRFDVVDDCYFYRWLFHDYAVFFICGSWESRAQQITANLLGRVFLDVACSCLGCCLRIINSFRSNHGISIERSVAIDVIIILVQFVFRDQWWSSMVWRRYTILHIQWRYNLESNLPPWIQ
jgi:hypothetical protein